jgi:hypothetical protein
MDWRVSFEVYEAPRASLRYLARLALSHSQRAEGDSISSFCVCKHKIFGDLAQTELVIVRTRMSSCTQYSAACASSRTSLRDLYRRRCRQSFGAQDLIGVWGKDRGRSRLLKISARGNPSSPAIGGPSFLTLESVVVEVVSRPNPNQRGQLLQLLAMRQTLLFLVTK